MLHYYLLSHSTTPGFPSLSNPSSSTHTHTINIHTYSLWGLTAHSALRRGQVCFVQVQAKSSLLQQRSNRAAQIRTPLEEGGEREQTWVTHQSRTKNTQNMISHNNSPGCPISIEGSQLLPCSVTSTFESKSSCYCHTTPDSESEKEPLVNTPLGEAPFYSLIMRNNYH